MGQGRDSDPRRCEKEGYLMPLEDLLVVAMISRRNTCTDASCGLSTSHYDMGYHQRKKSRLKPEFKDSIIMDHDQNPLARWSTKISAADYQNTIKLLSV